MRGRKSDSKEIEALNAGLVTAQGEDYIPPDVEEILEPKSVEELVEQGKLGDRLKDAVRVRNGWVWIMLRRKVGHGNFKATIEEHRLKYNDVRQDMCYARAVQRFPGFAGKITGHAIRHILTLPESAIHKIEEQITGIPAKEAEKITRGWIEKEYHKIQAEKERPKRKKVYADAAPSDLGPLVADALSALMKIAELELPPHEHTQAKKYWIELQAAWDRASYNLRDPEHKTPPLWELDPMHDDVSAEVSGQL